MDKEKILKIIDLKLKIQMLNYTDKERKEVMENNPYAIAEGFQSDNMRRIDELEKEIEKIN